MKRRYLVTLTFLLTLVFIVWQAPASVIGAALRQATHGAWDLAGASGTVWNGQGAITGKAGQDAPQANLPPLGWRLAGLKGGSLRFLVTSSGQPAGEVLAGLAGWQANLRGLSMDAKEATPLLPGLLSKGDWRGLLNFQQVAANGNWRSAQVSQLEMAWLNAATGLMPKGELGSFVIKGQSENQGLSFSISSQDGPLQITGLGSFSAQQGFRFNGELTDNAGLAAQFPGFLGAYLQPTGQPGRYTLRISQLDL